MPLRAVRLEARLPGIGRRLAGDVTSGRRDDLRAAAVSIGAAEGAGVEDMVIGNDRPAGVTARVVMTFPGWLQDPLVRPRGLRPCREGSGQRRPRGPTAARA